MKITVDITETLSRGVAVEADSNEAAIEIVKKGYHKEEYVLDSSDFCGVEFRVEDDTVPSVVTLDKGIDPRCLVLIKTGNEAETCEGRQLQTAQAAYIDGYITATGELSRFIKRLWKTNKDTASTVYHALSALRSQQNASYNAMCERLNDKTTWDDTVIVEATFTSVWDGGTLVVSKCKINKDTREIFDIQPADDSSIEALNCLDYELVTIDGVDYDAASYDETDGSGRYYWYKK